MVFKVELEDKQQTFVKALLNKVLMGTTINAPSATVTDFDLDRIEFTEGGMNFAIRMWNVKQTGNDIHVEWTLFHIVPDENGSHGNDLCNGETVVTIKK